MGGHISALRKKYLVCLLICPLLNLFQRSLLPTTGGKISNFLGEKPLPEISPRESELEDPTQYDTSCSTEAQNEGDTKQKLSQHMSFLDQSCLDDECSDNRRLLPATRNGLHIIDGPEFRYHVGIIDFFTLYECRQRTGRFLKTVKNCSSDHSTLPPKQYGDRFIRFIQDYVT